MHSPTIPLSVHTLKTIIISATSGTLFYLRIQNAITKASFLSPSYEQATSLYGRTMGWAGGDTRTLCGSSVVHWYSHLLRPPLPSLPLLTDIELCYRPSAPVWYHWPDNAARTSCPPSYCSFSSFAPHFFASTPIERDEWINALLNASQTTDQPSTKLKVEYHSSSWTSPTLATWGAAGYRSPLLFASLCPFSAPWQGKPIRLWLRSRQPQSHRSRRHDIEDEDDSSGERRK
ncbi:hypothetical protein BKA70DRAFT_1526912 [Coprinopsis sp. MPI-PUGE-AT-0042]|nr:hypothetical protein BKA70DRAFT_1526912 [Coprinopsis sp. MPI-PUGE-AT-0042]